MKSILLTTTAIVAFAGAAAAGGHTSVGFGGDVTFGVNNDEVDGENGFYFEGDLNVTGSATLDNGLTAGLKLEFDLFDETNGQIVESDGVLMSLTSENAGLYLGDTSFAAETQWKSAGDMEADAFSEADGENVLRADMSYSGFDASVSAVVTHAAGKNAGDNGMVNAVFDDEGLSGTLADDTAAFQDNDEMFDQLSFGVSGAVGMFSVSVAYQEESVSAGLAAAAGEDGLDLDKDQIGELVAAGLYAPAVANGDFTENEVFGISAGVAVAGADVTLAFAQKSGIGAEEDKTSMGIQVAYPFGPVTATVYYVAEDDSSDADVEDNYGVRVAYADGPISAALDYDNDQGVDKWNLDGSYDTGLGVTLLAGMQNENEGDDNDYYVGGTYDLGGGANILFVYADDVDGDQGDEIGAGEYMPGTTVEVSFSF